MKAPSAMANSKVATIFLIFWVVKFSDCKTDFLMTPLVKSSATSSLITRVPEVKLFGLAQTKYLRFYTFEFV